MAYTRQRQKFNNGVAHQMDKRIQSQCSVEIEKAMFDDVLRGMSVDQVLDKYHNDTAGSNVVDDHSVEFF